MTLHENNTLWYKIEKYSRECKEFKELSFHIKTYEDFRVLYRSTRRLALNSGMRLSEREDVYKQLLKEFKDAKHII